MGGGNFAGSFGPIDAAMVPKLGANRFEFAPAKGITVEYSNDAGKTWKDYGATDIQKLNLGTQVLNANLIIGKVKSSTPANDMLRITYDTSSDGISLYTILNKFCIYAATRNSENCYCTIQKALQSTPSTFIDVVTNITIGGDSGYNIINTPDIITYGRVASNQYGRIRFIFGNSGNKSDDSGLIIQNIFAFGGSGWTVPSTMASNGHLYSYDGSQNATFPAKVTATGGFKGSLDGTATNASKVNNHTVESNVPSSAKFTDENVKQTSTQTSGYSNYRPLIIGNANSGTKGFIPTTMTAQTLVFNNMYVQPSTGTIYATNFDGKINNHTVLSDVPSDAKFTDTTYDPIEETEILKLF